MPLTERMETCICMAESLMLSSWNYHTVNRLYSNIKSKGFLKIPPRARVQTATTPFPWNTVADTEALPVLSSSGNLAEAWAEHSKTNSFLYCSTGFFYFFNWGSSQYICTADNEDSFENDYSGSYLQSSKNSRGLRFVLTNCSAHDHVFKLFEKLWGHQSFWSSTVQ